MLGLFLLVTWIARRHLPAATRRLPVDVVESLGRTSLSPRQDLHLVRVGRMLVLLGSTPQGLTALAEIHDPDEVQRIERLCRPESTGVAAATFQKVLAQLDQPARESGWTDGARAPASAASARRPRLREVSDA